ncbi:metal-dependent hydrolase [Natrinema hispanicum]|uniref:LexA-binding, inner membrane-associated putative hydrolase n=1 Tax=Natrinema hispanicum TaxID=392421 RepID=A0A1I0D5Y2_9EURY|nr:metal-dependent hydrolase [Natrinema hispanicum]SDD16448.1 LexA-binding, inner membrane-associated putative hydrolase [Natrinema hispanicum]SET27590.1 LexA-binding, inner membrane-associated putative hydrolase [Natrinema hispanicum]
MNKKGHVLNAVLLSIGLGYLFVPVGDVETFKTIIMIGVPITLGALFPDVDTAFGKHRKTLHNLPVLLGFVAFPYVFGNLEYVWIGVLTHYVLDVAGSKRGIALFYPISTQEYGLPTGVTVSSKRADFVTAVVTVGELALAAMVVFELPQLVFELGRQLVGL